MARIVSMGVLLATLVVGVPGVRAGAKTVAASAQTAPETIDVKIDNFTFGPADVTVKAGATITWTNRDDIPHTVVSPDKVFKSKVLDTDDHFSFTFASPGTFTYFCSIHPKMTGRIVVK